jgi:hypothetical protein
MQEVSRAHSTKRKDGRRKNPHLKSPYGKERIQCEPLPPYYISGFVDGEGSFCVNITKHKTLKRKVEIRAMFEIELRADDRRILERIVSTIGCGRIYDCSYERYGWFPHVKLKSTKIADLVQYVIPFFDRYELYAKKKHVYQLFRKIVFMVSKKEHLTDDGFNEILKLREEMRKYGRKPNMKK